MPALILLLSLLADSSTLELPNYWKLQPSSYALSHSLVATDTESVCKVPDANEYEPCAWQDEREAEAQKAAQFERETKIAKAKCSAGGCLVVREKASVLNMTTYTLPYTTYLGPNGWRCDCKATPRLIKKGGK